MKDKKIDKKNFMEIFSLFGKTLPKGREFQLSKNKKAVTEKMLEYIIWIVVFLIALGAIYFLYRYLTTT